MLLLVLVLVLFLVLLAAWLLAWSCLHGHNSHERRALQLDEGDLLLNDVNSCFQCLQRAVVMLHR